MPSSLSQAFEKGAIILNPPSGSYRSIQQSQKKGNKIFPTFFFFWASDSTLLPRWIHTAIDQAAWSRAISLSNPSMRRKVHWKKSQRVRSSDGAINEAPYRDSKPPVLQARSTELPSSSEVKGPTPRQTVDMLLELLNRKSAVKCMRPLECLKAKTELQRLW